MKDLTWCWIFAMPLLPFLLAIAWLSDAIETPRPVREAKCRAAVVHACDCGDLAAVGSLLTEWERIRPDAYEPRTGKVVMSSTTMAPGAKLAFVRNLAAKGKPGRGRP